MPITLRPSNALSIDGGGGRIIESLYFIRRFYELANIPQNQIYKYNAVIAGTSAGSTLGLAIAYGLTLDELEVFFTEEVKWIFTIRSAIDVISGSINASYPSNRPNGLQKGLFLADDDPFYESVSEDSNYGSARLKRALTDLFGDATLQDLKTNVVIPAYQLDTNTPVIFSNLDYPEFIGQNEKIVNVALASGAAPLYLPFATFGGHTYGDGGLFENNPSLRAYSVLVSQSKIASKWNVLSSGTGLGLIGFDSEKPQFSDDPTGVEANMIAKILSYYDISTIGPTESISHCLKFMSEYSNHINYYRYQPYLDYVNYDTDLDNTDPVFQAYLASLGLKIFNDDPDGIATFRGLMSS